MKLNWICFTNSFKNKTWLYRQVLVAVLCNLSAVIVGNCVTWLGPFGSQLMSSTSPVPMSSHTYGWIVSVMEIADGIMAIPAGLLIDRWGRKQVLLWTAPICLTSWVLVAISKTVFSLYICRLMQGAVESLVLIAAPIYIAEISSSNIRGALEANIIFSTTLGVFYSYFIASYFSFTNFIYLSMILPILFFITFIFMPESPYYHLMIKNELEANKTLSWLRANDNINEELNEIKKTVDEDMNRKIGFKDLFATESDCKIFTIVQLVNSAGVFCGIVSISELTEQTFNEVPLIWFTIDQISITIGVVLSLSSFIAIFFSDTIGRRILLIVSSIALTIANFIITLFYYLHEQTSINATSYIWLLYSGLFILCVFCNLGAFQLTRAIQAEYFPSHTRATGGALTGLLASLQLFIILKIYLPIKRIFGLYMNFLIYTVLNFLFTILMIKYIPESAGKTMGEINKNMMDEVSKNKLSTFL